MEPEVLKCLFPGFGLQNTSSLRAALHYKRHDFYKGIWTYKDGSFNNLDLFCVV